MTDITTAGTTAIGPADLTVIEELDRFFAKLGLSEKEIDDLKTPKTSQSSWLSENSSSSYFDWEVAYDYIYKYAKSWGTSFSFTSVPSLLFKARIALLGLPVSAVVGTGLLAVTAGGIVVYYLYYGNTDGDKTIADLPQNQIDIEAFRVFGALAPLFLKSANVTSTSSREYRIILRYFQEEWGYKKSYLDVSLPLVLDQLAKTNLNDIIAHYQDFISFYKTCAETTLSADTFLLMNRLIKKSET